VVGHCPYAVLFQLFSLPAECGKGDYIFAVLRLRARPPAFHTQKQRCKETK
jgi:hypothetical protein